MRTGTERDRVAELITQLGAEVFEELVLKTDAGSSLQRQNIVDQEESILDDECPVCLQVMTTARELPCGHTLSMHM